MEKVTRPLLNNSRREILMTRGPENEKGTRVVYCDSKNCKKFSRWIATIVEDTSGYSVIDGPYTWEEDMWNNDYHPGCPKNRGA